jgi:hypothetical protein
MLLTWLGLKKKQRFIGGSVLTQLSQHVCMLAKISWYSNGYMELLSMTAYTRD